MKINTLIKVTGNLFISFFSQEKMNLSLIAKIKMNNTRKETIPNHCYFYGAQMFRGLWYYEEEGTLLLFTPSFLHLNILQHWRAVLCWTNDYFYI